MKTFCRLASAFALVAVGCGAPSDVLYVGSALAEAGPPDTGPPQPETSTPLDANGPPDAPVVVTDATDGGSIFDPVCTPAVDFQNLDPQGGGKVFLDNFKSPSDYVVGLARRVCATLYRSPVEVPPIARVTVGVQPIPNVPPNFTGTANGTSMTINSNFFVPFANTHTADETAFELSGMGAHLLSYMYEHGPAPMGVISGINDFVRYRLGYIRDSRRVKGGAWDDGYMTTAFFFVYLDDQYPDFVYKLNLVLGTGYSVTAFQVFTGKDVTTLWNEYQATL